MHPSSVSALTLPPMSHPLRLSGGLSEWFLQVSFFHPLSQNEGRGFALLVVMLNEAEMYTSLSGSNARSLHFAVFVSLTASKDEECHGTDHHGKVKPHLEASFRQ